MTNLIHQVNLIHELDSVCTLRSTLPHTSTLFPTTTCAGCPAACPAVPLTLGQSEAAGECSTHHSTTSTTWQLPSFAHKPCRVTITLDMHLYSRDSQHFSRVEAGKDPWINRL